MNNVNKASSTISKKDVFTAWLEFTKPMHKLPDSDIKVLAVLLEYRFNMSKKIIDGGLLNKLWLSTENRKELMGLLDVDASRFNNMLSSLRRQNVMDGDVIRKAFIPNYDGESDKYSIVLEFKIK